MHSILFPFFAIICILSLCTRNSDAKHHHETTGVGGGTPLTGFCRSCSDLYCGCYNAGNSNCGQSCMADSYDKFKYTCRCEEAVVGREMDMRASCRTDCGGQTPKSFSCSGKSCDCACGGAVASANFDFKNIMAAMTLSAILLVKGLI